MKYRGIRLALALVVGVLGLFAVQGCDNVQEVVQPPSDDGSAQPGEEEESQRVRGVLPDPVILHQWAPNLRGEWTADVRVTRDTCGIGVGSPLREIDIGQHGKQLTLFPLDAASNCGNFPILLEGIEGGESYSGVINGEPTSPDACVARFFSVFSAEFRSQEFVATEETEISYVSGDCGAFTTRCEWFLEATAERCTDCQLICGEDAVANGSRIGGPLGWPVQVDISTLQNVPED